METSKKTPFAFLRLLLAFPLALLGLNFMFLAAVPIMFEWTFQEAMSFEIRMLFLLIGVSFSFVATHIAAPGLFSFRKKPI